MVDLDLLRAEIKTWERNFASTHGRDPSVQDIRSQPPIAEKYKLYKKLSKPPPNPPSTPPRVHSRLPAPKSRTAESVPPLPGFNPFSPVKKTAKRNGTLHPPTSMRTSSHSNLFATPIRNVPQPHPRTSIPSPHPLLSIPQSHPSDTASSSQVLPVSTTAVSRARKRLRGEPVSPSPSKPKRQRIRSQALPSVPKADQDSSNSGHEADQPRRNLTSFVADSPIKAPAGGKSFKLLFDDALPSLPIPKRPVNSSVAQFDSPDSGLLQRASVDFSVPASHKLHDPKPKGVVCCPDHRVNCTRAKILCRTFPEKDQPPAQSRKPTFKTVDPEDSQPKTSMKRSLDGRDSQLEQTGFSTVSESQYSLIPPSPPPQDPINRDIGKAKAKSTAGRKKSRIEDTESDVGVDSPDDIAPKVATVSLDRRKHSHRHTEDLDWDPLPHLGTRNHDPAVKEQIDANHHASDTFSVNLPDKFRRVLAISPSRTENGNEERVVRGLLYGLRVGHYDPSRGGDIWDAGETDEGALGDVETEGEGDWEGEPVPWEAGEL